MESCTKIKALFVLQKRYVVVVAEQKKNPAKDYKQIKKNHYEENSWDN